MGSRKLKPPCPPTLYTVNLLSCLHIRTDCTSQRDLCCVQLNCIKLIKNAIFLYLPSQSIVITPHCCGTKDNLVSSLPNMQTFTISFVLTIMSPSSGISRILCLIIPLCATEPSDLRTQLSELFPNGILFKSHFFVARPTPQAPVNKTPQEIQGGQS